MYRRLLQRKRTIISSWLISYLAIFLIPIIVFSILYLNVQEITRTEIKNYQELAIKKMGDDMDVVLQNAQNISYNICFSPTMENILNSKQISKTMIKDLLGLFSSALISNKNVYDCYYYFADEDLIITSSGFTETSKTYYELFIKKSNIKYEDWKKQFLDRKKSAFLAYDIYNESVKTTFFSYVLPVSELNIAEKKCTLVIIIDDIKFMHNINNMRKVHSSEFAILSNEKVIYSSDPNLGQIDGIEKLSGVRGLVNLKVGKNNVMAYYTNSNVNNWKYVSFIPKYVFDNKFNIIRKLWWIYLIICIPICIVMVFFSLRHNYKPINQLMSSIKGNFKEVQNEYDYIKKAIEKTIQDKNIVFNELEKQTRLAKELYILKLINGDVDNVTIDLLNSKNINFDGEYYCSVIIKPVDYFNLFGEDSDLNTEKRLESALLIIKNISDELIGEKFTVVSHIMDGSVISIINFNDDIGLFSTKFHSIFNNLRLAITDNFDFDIIIGCGDYGKGLEMIGTSYNQALIAIGKFEIIDNQNVLYYHEIEDTNTNYFYPIEKEQQLINSIKTGNNDLAHDVLNLLFSVNLEIAKKSSTQKLKLLVYDVYCTIFKIIPNIKYDNLDLSKTFNIIAGKSDINQMRHELFAVIDEICEGEGNKNSGTNNSLIKKTINFILKNYNDYNLNVNMIADYLSITSSHLSRIFKEQTGGNVLAYIQNVRIERAKELLDTNNTIEEIANRVGFANSNTFIRVFKKNEGISPTQYRRNLI